jgi:hypothetical protein
MAEHALGNNVTALQALDPFHCNGYKDKKETKC